MKCQIRLRSWETNSSSAHSLLIMKKHQVMTQKEIREEYYLDEQLMKYGSNVASSMIRLSFSNDQSEYIDNLHHAMLNVMRTKQWLEIAEEKGLIEDRTYVSLRRECLDLIDILMRKLEDLAEELGI